MSRVIMLLYLTALFVALSPGILLTIPKKGSRLVVAVVHGLLLATILYFTYNEVYRLSGVLISNTPFEGFTINAKVTDTWLRGKKIFGDGNVIGAPSGQYQSRPTSM
jgi:hypothetical protein